MPLPQARRSRRPRYGASVQRECRPAARAGDCRAPDLARFPETHILTAELDQLRYGAERFAAGLLAAGVPVTITCYDGALHGSPILTGTWS